MNLINTTVFRMALQLAVVFALIAIIAQGSVYYITFDEIEEQADRELIHELSDLSNIYSRSGIEVLKFIVKQRDQYGAHLHHYYALHDKFGEILAGNRSFSKSVKGYLDDGQSVNIFTSDTVFSDDIDESIMRVATRSLPGDYRLLVGQANVSMAELREHTFSAVVAAVLLTLFFAIIGGVYMGKGVLFRIQQIDEGLSDAIANDFRQGLTVPAETDEFQSLTKKLNQMLARIESLLKGMRQVTDNIAHDLRSPLNRMKSRLEVTLLQPRSDEEYRDVMSQAIEDCNNLLNTFNSLLNIAQLEAGVRGQNWDDINLTTLVDELSELYYIVAEEKGLIFLCEKAKDIFIKGNKDMLAQAVSNLLENAIKYTKPGDSIKITVALENNSPVIRICDSGVGIPEKDRARVLERFQRLDSARSSAGNGLGLSLVNAVVKLHSAKLFLSDNQPGLCIEICFVEN